MQQSHAQPVFLATDKGSVLPWNILDGFAVKGGEDETTKKLPADSFNAEYHEDGVVSPPNDIETIIRLSEINTWHNRCATAKATDTAGLGYSFKPSLGFEDVSEKDIEIIKQFFEDKSAHGRPFDKICTDMAKDKELIGHMCLEIVREGYDPEAIPALMTHIKAQTVRPHHEGNKYLQKRGEAKRWFKRFGYGFDVDCDTGEEYPLRTLPPEQRASEIIWDNGFHSQSDFFGQPDILSALGALEGMEALRNYNISFFLKHGVPAWAIYITGDYNLGQLLRFELETDEDNPGTIGEVYDSQNENHTASKFEYSILSAIKQQLARLAEDPYAPILIAIPGNTTDSRVEIEFKALSTEAKDGSFTVYREDQIDEILVAHGVPGYRVGINTTGALGGNSAKESSKIYRDSVIRPSKESLATLFTFYVIRQGFQIDTVELKYADLDVIEETEDKRLLAEFMFDRAAMTPAQIIITFGERFGVKPPPDDEYPELYTYYLNGVPVKTIPQEMSEEPDIDENEDDFEMELDTGNTDVSDSDDEQIKAAVKGLQYKLFRSLLKRRK
ncbi:MAG: hypothetical protein GY841_20065 [FCB group bacterium]|nr:hypothetical protein [FCB group bacterium]